MHSSDVREWIEAYEQSRRRREKEKAQVELDRLALITRDEDQLPGESAYGPDWQRETSGVGQEEWPVSKPVDAATRLVLLMGVAIIASLAGRFG
jgi:hypothetical protein